MLRLMCVYARRICEKTRRRVCVCDSSETTGFVLGRCDCMLIVACVETSERVNLCAPDSASNTEGGRGTYSWLGSRQAVQSCECVRDKAVSTSQRRGSLREPMDKMLVSYSM